MAEDEYKQETQRVLFEHLEGVRSKEEQVQRIQDDLDYEQGKADPSIVKQAHEDLKSKSEWYKKNGIYEELLTQKIVRLYGEKHG